MNYTINDLRSVLWHILKIFGIIGTVLAGLFILLIIIVCIVVGMEEDAERYDDFGYMIYMAEQEKSCKNAEGMNFPVSD